MYYEPLAKAVRLVQGYLDFGSVLIVEDEWLVSMEIEALLEDAGYQTVGVAVSADEAVLTARPGTGPTSS